MSTLDYKPDYRKNLPHIQPPGATFFVTCRLAGLLPRSIIERLQREAGVAEKTIIASAPGKDQPTLLERVRRQAFGRFDSALDAAASGPTWLRRADVATIVMDSLHFLDGRYFELDVFCVMCNHLHIVFTPMLGDDGKVIALQRILHSLNRHTACEANKVLQRKGQFWQRESYDHFVRNDRQLNRIQQYVLNNPVKAGLVDDAREWPFSWASWCWSLDKDNCSDCRSVGFEP